MRNASMICIGLACWTFACAAARAKVDVEERQVTRKMKVADYNPDQGSPRSMYHDKSTIREIDHTFPLVTLDNGLLRVEVVPSLGARVLNAVDLKTGRSFAGTPEGDGFSNDLTDHIGWNAGYVEASFPYFEHGLGVRQPAGYRIVKHPDGAISVAMHMVFTQHQEPRHMGRYGRYSQRVLQTWVTLRPGESRYTATYRLDNPNPLRRGHRLWTNIILHADQYDERHIIYPAGYVVPHGAGSVRPFYAEGGKRDWVNVSHFALFTDYGFMGVYSPNRDTNCMIALGNLYFEGVDLDHDATKALSLYKAAAAKGDALGAYNAGLVYETSADDLTQAIGWYWRAATGGDEGGMYKLALAYQLGQGLPADEAQAVTWMRKAAEAGSVDAINDLGSYYLQGYGVPVDEARALMLYVDAAKQGSAVALANVAAAYHNGEGVEVDQEKALRLFALSARAGNLTAYYDLGQMYEDGEGVKASRAKAAQLYRMAAESPDEDVAEMAGDAVERLESGSSETPIA